MKRLYTTDDPILADFIMMALRDHAIEGHLDSVHVAGTHTWLRPIGIHVSAKDEARAVAVALEVLASWTSSAATGPGARLRRPF